MEEMFTSYLKRMEEMGMGPSLMEFREIVQDYLNANNICVTQFKDNLPGYDWTSNFLQRHKLTLKKGGMMQVARKNVTSDPFVIYGYFDLLKKEMERLNIINRPECIWNADETGFPQDPSKTKSIGTIGRKTVRITCGANRENTTVLATCCANGGAMPPLIVFKGARMHDSWMGKEALDGTMYAVSPSGWMTTPIFEEFFENFVKFTHGTRPLLLILDGHLSHTSLKTVELAKTEQISIMKLPAHCTDLLQPLDVSCFGPLKNYYDKALFAHTHLTAARDPIRKDGFTNLLGSVWHKGLSVDNIKAGFSATGIFPLDGKKYKTSRLDRVKLMKYQLWEEAGKPTDGENNPILEEVLQEVDETNQETAVDIRPSTSGEMVKEADVSTYFDYSQKDINSPQLNVPSKKSNYSNVMEALRSATTLQLISELKSRAPEDCSYQITIVEKAKTQTLEEIIRSRGRQSSGIPSKRRRLNMKGMIITQEEGLKQIEENKKPKKLIKKKPILKKDIDSDAETSCSGSFKPDDESDDPGSEDFEEIEETNEEISEKGVKNVYESDIGKYFAVYYTKPLVYYWGKVLKIFTTDEDNEVAMSIEFEFLHKRTPSSNPSEWTWTEKNNAPDVKIVERKYVFYGPVKPSCKKDWVFPDLVVTEIFKMLKS